ncbi:MAG: hypothetical protein ABH841_00035 [Candidatus Nealsonbacteria bacterium]
MASKPRFFEKGQPVHIISRALTDVFKNQEDCYRFIFQFYTANIGRKSSNLTMRDAAMVGEALLQGEKISSKFIIEEHDPLADLLDFSLVVNHNHFCLIPNAENAIPILMGKLNNGFAKYFNITHKRKDAVFGSRYKGVPITTDFQSYAVCRYISIINPLDVFQPGWREGGLKNPKEAMDFLTNYEFSSFPDRINKRSASILAPKDVLEKYAFQTNSESGRIEFQNFVEEFLKEKSQFIYLE